MTKDEVIQTLKCMRSEIDNENWLFVGTINPQIVDMAIESLQTDIVRCKDCEYWKGNGTFTINGNGEEEKLCKWWSKFGTINTAESGFCSYGERREP